MSETSNRIYDDLAPFYREYSENKTFYIKAVDDYILRHIPRGTTSLLDVGAGDGIRGIAIANKKGIRRIVLSDPSPEMAYRCRQLQPTEVWQVSAEELPLSKMRFDIIICLWNVLGHINSSIGMMKALVSMRKLLSDDGLLFLDVNNRHNAAAYGWLRVFARIFIDYIYPDERRGDANFDWKIGNHILKATGHLFTPNEVERNIDESNLRIKARVAVNYSNGTISNNLLKGQLLYCLEKK